MTETASAGGACTRRARTFAALRSVATLVAAIVAAQCGPPAAPAARPPATAPAPASPFRLPVVGADGAAPAAVRIAVPLLPPVLESTSADGEPADLAEAWAPPEPGTDETTVAPAWPDVDALLDGLDVEHATADGVVTFSGDDAETAGRVLVAAHAAVSRTARVEVVVVRLAQDAPVPTAERVLAARGADVAARIDRELHDGAALVADLRETCVLPADVDVGDDTVTARAVAFEIGPFLAVSPARIDAGRHVLRIAFHESRAVSERRIAGDDVARVAPSLTVTALVLSAPAVSGRADVAVADAAGGRPGFAVAWRVTNADDPAPPAGTRAFSIHADRPPFVCDAPPRAGIVSLLQDEPDADDVDSAEVPDLAEPATAGLRLVAAEPGIVVASGAEDALLRLDLALAQRVAARFPAARLRDGATSIPFVRVGDIVVVQGRLDPVVVAAEASASSATAGAATRTALVFTGRSLRISPDAGGARIEVSSAPAPEILLDAGGGWPRAATATESVARDVVDRVRVETTGSVRHVVVGADGLEVLAW